MSVNASRSCTILCGSILEGLLLDALNDDAERARDELQTAKNLKKRPGSLATWELGDLLIAAEKLRILEGTNLNLGSVVRDYRNLVHLGKQLRASQVVTANVAGLAIGAVTECIQALDRRARSQQPLVESAHT